jgi:hypothetical protein
MTTAMLETATVSTCSSCCSSCSSSSSSSSSSKTDRFQIALLQLVLNHPNVVSFSRGILQIHDPESFVSDGIFHLYFPGAKHYRSFLRQLYYYNWRKMAAPPPAAAGGGSSMVTAACYYVNPYLEGEKDPHCLLEMKPRKRGGGGTTNRSNKKKTTTMLPGGATPKHSEANGELSSSSSSCAGDATSTSSITGTATSSTSTSSSTPPPMTTTTSTSSSTTTALLRRTRRAVAAKTNKSGSATRKKKTKSNKAQQRWRLAAVSSPLAEAAAKSASIMDCNDLPELLQRKKLRRSSSKCDAFQTPQTTFKSHVKTSKGPLSSRKLDWGIHGKPDLAQSPNTTALQNETADDMILVEEVLTTQKPEWDGSCYSLNSSCTSTDYDMQGDEIVEATFLSDCTEGKSFGDGEQMLHELPGETELDDATFTEEWLFSTFLGRGGSGGTSTSTSNTCLFSSCCTDCDNWCLSFC